MKRLCIAIVVAASAPAFADPVARCEQGLIFASAAKPDLPRAALYLEGCDSLDVEPELADKIKRARADVGHKLDASKLSAMSIVTTPEGMVAETNAMPGERFATPATIWAKAGDYKIDVAADAATLDAGKGMTTTATLEAFSRRTVIINMPQKKQAAPKDGKVSFEDEAEEQKSQVGPPPAQKFGSILPKKYRKPSAGSPAGPQLEDPLAVHTDDSLLAWRFGARIGGGVFLHDAAAATATFSVAALAARPLAGPLSLATRLGWTHRDVDSVALEVGVSLRLAATRSMVLSTGAALRGEVRVQDELAMQEVARVGLGAAAELDLALLDIPLAIGLRLEPGFTELTPGTRAHAALLEVGYDWR